MREPSNKADWLSFVLQFAFGLVVGALIGWPAILPGRHASDGMREDLILPYLLGCGLFVGGLFARLGDQLWLSGSFRVIPPDAPRHSRCSLFLAYACMAIGACLTIFSLYRHFS